MRTNHKHILAAAVLALGFSAAAQETSRSAYFLDGYSMRHQLNPAFSGERGYFSFPVLGNLNIAVNSNVGVNTFIYKMADGQLTTFMNKSVSADEFLSKIDDNNKINFGTDITIFSAGFRGFKGYNTITVGVRTDVGVNLPRGLFEFMKLGQTGSDTQYSFDDLSVKANAMAEIALGHSHRVNDRLDIGAKIKVLLGGANVNAKIDQMQVRMSDSQWSIDAIGEMDIAAGKGLYVPTKQEAGVEYDNASQASEIEWDEIDYDSFGMGGYGLAFDLGATYNLLPNLQLSAAVRDLGFMKWSDNVNAKTPGTSWKFNGFEDIAIDDTQPGYDDNKIDEQFDRMWDDMQDMINFRKTNEKTTLTTALAATIHLGAEYTMPFYSGLSGGLLLTEHINGPFSWTEGRISANIKPTKWLNASVNYAVSTFGSEFGWMFNFHPCGFNLFIGSDCQFFKVTPQYVPVGNLNASLTMGINFTFGS